MDERWSGERKPTAFLPSAEGASETKVIGASNPSPDIEGAVGQLLLQTAGNQYRKYTLERKPKAKLGDFVSAGLCTAN